MISPFTHADLSAVRHYFKEHLAVGDYYSQNKAAPGEWFGKGARRLNLPENVQEAAFQALCEGKHPDTGKRLTQRHNTVRKNGGKLVANRRIFQDWTISPPKSVSVAALLGDSRIIAAHDRAVRAALTELETFAETRVRRGGSQDGVRGTGNLVVALFRHDTSRELDPQLHTHCAVFNATFDAAEDRWKALQTHGMFRAQRFTNGVYEHELSRELHALGYRTRSLGRSFEIEGISHEVIERFSKRRRQIDAETEARISKGGTRGNIKDVREQVAHDKRRRKIREANADNLRTSWLGQLSDRERAALKMLRKSAVEPPAPAADLHGVIGWAEQHVFERNSVVPQHELWAAALVRARGQEFGLAGLREAVRGMKSVFFLEDSSITSRELVRLEMEVDRLARRGVTESPMLNGEFQPAAKLTDEQRRAVTKILHSQSFITIFRGGAGTGKSTSLQEVRRGLVESGHNVVVLAPQRQQVIDLQADGLPAQTLASFLLRNQFEPRTALLVDESGQIGIRDMHQLVSAARVNGARLILSGDTRQHGAVAASDALVLLERYSGVPVARLRNIRRQDPRLVAPMDRAAVSDYRRAVRLASRGRASDALDLVDRLGWVRELPPEKGREALAEGYLASLDRKERPLVVAQTWREVDAVNDAVRARLAAAGRLGPSVTIQAYRTVDLTQAERREAAQYPPGTEIYFVRRYGRYQAGDRGIVVRASKGGLTLLKDGRRSPISFRYADRFVIIEARDVELAPGDRLQLKMNGKSAEGAAIANGELVTVRSIHGDGSMLVEDSRSKVKTLGAHQRVLNLGYATTSYGSQGKTVDTVLFSDAGSRLATNQKQFYVTMSRGRKRALIFTPDKAALRVALANDGHRMLAVEGVRNSRRNERQRPYLASRL